MGTDSHQISRPGSFQASSATRESALYRFHHSRSQSIRCAMIRGVFAVIALLAVAYAAGRASVVKNDVPPRNELSRVSSSSLHRPSSFF
jgi:hypothetical protein